MTTRVYEATHEYRAHCILYQAILTIAILLSRLSNISCWREDPRIIPYISESQLEQTCMSGRAVPCTIKLHLLDGTDSFLKKALRSAFVPAGYTRKVAAVPDSHRKGAAPGTHRRQVTTDRAQCCGEGVQPGCARDQGILSDPVTTTKAFLDLYSHRKLLLLKVLHYM